MTEKDVEIQDLRRRVKRLEEENNYLRQSETVLYYLRKGLDGQYENDVTALDRGIQNLHTRCREAEKDAQASKAEAVYYRRKYEALEMERKEEEENRFPLFQSDERADENEHP